MQVIAPRSPRRSPRTWGCPHRAAAALLLCMASALVVCRPPSGGGPGVGFPDGSAACPPVSESGTRYLRALSLDLRGAPPSADELRDVSTGARSVEQILDAMLDSESFAARVRD